MGVTYYDNRKPFDWIVIGDNGRVKRGFDSHDAAYEWARHEASQHQRHVYTVAAVCSTISTSVSKA